MTLIIGAITHNYVLLAADRRLTFITGPDIGKVKDHDSCKLVNLCNHCAIGYTGLAEIQQMETHEWIAVKLADANCTTPKLASEILKVEAESALKGCSPKLKRQAFLMAGWSYFDGLDGLRPHFCLVANAVDSSGKWLTKANDEFTVRIQALKDDIPLMLRSVGAPTSSDRMNQLGKNLKTLIERKTSPEPMLRYLFEEIGYTAQVDRTVGKKVLGVCIPRITVETQKPFSAMVANQPLREMATFTYFDPSYNQLRQYGPTFVCGESAITDVETKQDDSRNYQSSKVRLLRIPKPRK